MAPHDFKDHIRRINMLNKKIFATVFAVGFLMCVSAQAAEDAQQQLLGDSPDTCCAVFEAAKADYYKDNRYRQFFDLLDSLKNGKTSAGPCVNYYKALSRYDQLKYLEEKQVWDEYFAQGNAYRDQVVENAQKTIASDSCGECLRLKGLLLLWRFHSGQQDAFNQQALNDLMSNVASSAKQIKNPEVLKTAADELMAYGEKAKAREVYKVYFDKIITAEAKDEDLKSTAEAFYKEGNLELAESVYDIYLERIIKSWPKDKLAAELILTAQKFAYKPDSQNDMLYAEKIFKKVDELGLKDIFNQDLIYLRAFNLEKAKEYKGASEFYALLTKDFPGSSRNEEALYKLGLINMYALGDAGSSRGYFDQLIAKEDVSPYVIQSLYQSGLLWQWQGDNQKAKELYNKLLTLAGGNFPEAVKLANERIREIDEAKPLDYNLKTFLGLSLSGKNKEPSVPAQAGINSSNYILNKEQKITVSSNGYQPQNGCMQVELQYLWAGNTGLTKPAAGEGSFQTSYSDAGTKEISLVVVSAAGVVDWSFDMLDVR